MTRKPSTASAGSRAPAVRPLPGAGGGGSSGADSAVLLRSLRRSYGPVVAVDDLSLRIAPGESVALLGPNGAGKSTTVDMLLGLSRPDAGEVRLFGLTPEEAIRAGRVGAMLQNAGLPADLTVGEVAEMVASLHRAPVPPARALERAGVADLARRRAGRLSGGQRQRVCFALALLPDPDLLVLDEPTAGMDVESRRAFWQAIRQQTSAGRTVLFATHYLQEADEYADRIVLVRSGRIVADGPANEIRAQAGRRTIRATLSGVDDQRLAALAALPGVVSVEPRGVAVLLSCSDSDAALRALLACAPDARDIEVSGVGLEEAFLTLTTDDGRPATDGAGTREAP